MTVTHTSPTQQLANYLRARAAQFYARYTDEALLDYVMFHVAQGTLAHTRRGPDVSGIMVGWAQDEPDSIPFAWQPHQRHGRFWYWHIYAADTPRDAIALARWFMVVHPACLARECLLERHGRTRRLPPGAVFTIYRKAQRYGNQS